LPTTFARFIDRADCLHLELCKGLADLEQEFAVDALGLLFAFLQPLVERGPADASDQDCRFDKAAGLERVEEFLADRLCQ